MRITEKLTDKTVAEDSAKLTLKNGDYIHYDFSKSHATPQDKATIKKKIEEMNLESKIEEMWSGKNVNYTEGRPVLHYLLRDEDVLDAVESGSDLHSGAGIIHESKQEIVQELRKMSEFTESFKQMKGVTGESFDTIVNIGIGGSDLGPRMVTDALQFYSQNRTVHFISNVDPTDTLKVFRKINPLRTLFVVVSKTFTTIETMENFKLALSIFRSSTGNRFKDQEICNKHFVAVSSNVSETSKYGIQTVFKMWDFVGGRYSLWSAVGLSISLYVGFKNYLRLLRGASEADTEFYKNRIDSIPVRMAVNELFYISKGFNNKCLVCYDSYLELMHKYLQQAEMESNGKHGSKQMIIWGGVGTDVQHSFFQLLHQGEQKIYLEFLCPVKNINLECDCRSIQENKDEIKYHHNLLAVSCLAQSRSMLIGKSCDDLNHHFDGDKPSVTIMYSRLTPEILGSLIAIYEHKIFVEGVYFGINSFDQFGVELGKALTKELMADLNTEGNNKADPSTESLLKLIKDE